jgi:hypothetical protein
MHRLHRLSALPWAVVATVVVAACTDAVTPVSPPLFSYSSNGITVNKVNGTLGMSGRILIKGFNPTNPHHGDAIIATFYWLGSTNIIDSVVDVLTNPSFTPVGNKYTLVEYVTSGGYSMATYVATNVQNFPDPNTDQGQVLAVRAHLSESVTDGGVKVSSWSGVEDNFAIALGEHRSASGSGTGSLPAQAGPIAVDAGGLVYTATMGALQSGAFTGLDAPIGYTSVGRGTDDFILEEATYAVQASAGTVDPTWTWLYGTPARPWLVSTLTLRAAPPPDAPPPPPPPPPATGDLAVNTSSSGSSIPSSYTATVDGTQSQTVASTGSVTFTSLSAASHTVVLSVPSNCTVSEGASQTVTVPGGGTATVSYTVNCITPPGDLAVNTSSSGANIPGSYTATVDGSEIKTIASTGSVTFTALSAGSHTLVLTVPANCTVSGGPSRTVTVPSGGTSTVSYAVSCNAPPVVNAGPDETAVTGLLYTFSWSFTDANHNGPWSYTINWGDGSTSSGTVSSEGSFSAGHTYVIILPRSFTISVTVRDASGASASDTKRVSVLLL